MSVVGNNCVTDGNFVWRISVVTGMNLGMVLESFFLLESDHLTEQLVNIGSQGISVVGTKVIDSEDE